MTAARLDLFARAVDRLAEALACPEDAIVRDACIQRFELAFETAWRAVQHRARREGIECVSPRDCLRTAFRLRLVEDDPGWLAMVEDRNRTVHLYDEAMALRVYRALPGHLARLQALLQRLRETESEAPAGGTPDA
jgi:nucleotidyltransferase substrate binding protein (TIGR01987 family)